MGEGFVSLESKLIYKGTIISLFVDKIKTPEGQVLKREVVKHLNAVGVVAITKDKEIILVKQYRHPIKSELIEIPAGLVEDCESPAECAIRELKEETGYSTERVEKLAEFYTSAGFTDEKLYLFFTDNVEEGEPEQEPGEEGMQIVAIPLKEAIEMVARGEIEDAKTIPAILMAAQRIGRIEL